MNVRIQTYGMQVWEATTKMPSDVCSQKAQLSTMYLRKGLMTWSIFVES